jgi:HSP20 family protein
MAKTEKETVQEPAGKGQEIQPTLPERALSPLAEMDRLLDNIFSRGWLRPFRDWPSWRELATSFEGTLPRVDVIDREAEIVVRAELPGVDKENVDVSLTDNTITIRGSTSHETRDEKGDYHRAEIFRGSFARTVSLPAGVDGSQAKANFKNGVLEVVMPKLTAATRRAIKVE